MTPPKKFVLISGQEQSGDMFSQLMDMNSPSTVFITGPEEVPDVATRRIDLPDLTYLSLDLQPLAIVTSKEAYDLSVSQRRCRFPHESNLRLSSVYSYGICRMECRMRLAYSLC
ncbi:Uncharacterized protein GBIM_08113, partial [Gryllus bimaculatus]